jgi:hypothetical protein
MKYIAEKTELLRKLIHIGDSQGWGTQKGCFY